MKTNLRAMLKKSSAVLAVIFLLTTVFSFSVFADPDGDVVDPETIANEVAINEGETNEGETNEGETNEGETEEGETEEGETNEGETNEGETDAGTTDAGTTDAGTADAGTTDAGTTTGIPAVTHKIAVSGGGWSVFSNILGFFTKYLGYILGILVFALIIKIVLFPLAIKQQKNSQKMAKLAPKQEAIRRKYAGRNDRATQMKMNEEIQNLYREEKFNPMSGCLPLLLQLPIIMLLYTSINAPLSAVSKSNEAVYVDTAVVEEILTENVEEYFYQQKDQIIENLSQGDLPVMQSQAIITISEANYYFEGFEDLSEEKKEELKKALDGYVNYVTVKPEEGTEGYVTINVADFTTVKGDATKKELPKDVNHVESISKLAKYYDTFKVGPINFIAVPSFTPIYNALIPFLVFLSSFFSTRLIKKFSYAPNQNPNDKSIKFMDIVMPLLILYFSFKMAAVIGLYWIFQNIISVVQQIIVSKLYPAKAPTAEEIREAELLMRGKRAKDRAEASYERSESRSAVKKAPIKKKKSNSPFIYAKKGIDSKYLENLKAKGVVPKAKKKP